MTSYYQVGPVPDFIIAARKIKFSAVYEDDREINTNSYWDFENQMMFPVTQGYLTAREDYPEIRSNLKFDRTVSEIAPNGTKVTKVVTAEDKRPGAPKGEVKKAEDHVEAKSLATMDATGLTSLYCQTTMGTAFRVWNLDARIRSLEPLFGPNSRADRRAYIDIRTSFGQYEWHRLGSLVKGEPVRPLQEFGILHYLTAPPEWMFKFEQMQLRLEAEQQQQVEFSSQYEQYGTATIDPSAADHSYPSENQGSSQGQAMEIDDASVAPEMEVEPGPEAEPGPSAAPSYEVQRRKKSKVKEVTIERRENDPGYKFVWKGRKDKVKTERDEWDKDGDVWTLRGGYEGYKVWGYKPSSR